MSAGESDIFYKPGVFLGDDGSIESCFVPHSYVNGLPLVEIAVLLGREVILADNKAFNTEPTPSGGDSYTYRSPEED